MATFNLTKNSQTTAITRLKPWTINSVVFKGVELKSGNTKDGGTWKAIQFKFSGDNGIFEPMFFCPKEGGDERMKGVTGDRKWELPSQMEQLAFTLAHVVGTLSPNGYAALQKVSLNLPDEFEKLVEYVQKALKPALNKTTNIKLIADNRGYAAVPNFIGINNDGEAFLSNNWIGENLAFTAGEVKKMEQAKNTKPTEIKDDLDDATTDNTENDDLDFDI